MQLRATSTWSSAVISFAILKLSYNKPGDSSLTGGICGTGFFLSASTAVTAHHALNNETLNPNPGHRYSSLWLISRNGSILQIEPSWISLHPEVDTSVIHFPAAVTGFPIYEASLITIVPGVTVHAIGHKGDTMPAIDAQWQGTELLIVAADLTQSVLDKDGDVKALLTLHINAPDVKIQGVQGVEVSFGSQVGMSGGPVLETETGRVIGMLSIGLPPDAYVKTRTFAILIAQLLKQIRSSNTLSRQLK